MRRLALQTRNDKYSSNRDYQQTHVRLSRQLVGLSGNKPTTIAFRLDLSAATDGLAGWGGYFAANKSSSLEWRISQNGRVLGEGNIGLDDRWSRFGALVDEVFPGWAELTLTIPESVSIDIWGLAADAAAESVGDKAVNLREADDALFPETIYLESESAIEIEFDPDESDKYTIGDGRSITLKKCSYCGRLLPIDPNRLGALAFHKHNAKKTKHQNECRACKKWKINDHFNPIRTADQHHESSTITRERKILLREPERLQEMKDRYGEGLRSKIWKKFDKKCFRCIDKSVELKEFQLDHTRPLAYLWPIDEYATCLCAECNNEKKEKFPIDFYTEEQLIRLSEITGLELHKLKQKCVNQIELARILTDLENFARRWEPRVFFAVARKIRELEPENDLELLLEAKNPELYSRLLFEYNQRPEISDDEEDEASDD